MQFLFNYQYHLIKPDSDLGHLNQIHQCISQIRSIRDNDPKSFIIRISWFYRLSEHLSCGLIRQYISFSGSGAVFSVSPAFIAQAPTDGSEMEVMVVVLPLTDPKMIRYKELSSIRYAVIDDGQNKWLFAGGSECTNHSLSCQKQSRNTFSLLKDILSMEKLGMWDLVRQWNYIGDILEQEIGERGLIQNYQEFNEVRSQWYSQNGLVQDYPAATGIGTKGGGVRIEFIASRMVDPFLVFSLKNPFQQDAHQYSHDQLVGANPQSTPKFERGKLIFNREQGYIWVSGTAAIRGEKSIAGTALEQAVVTTENITELISPANLKHSGLRKLPVRLHPVYIRGYVKHFHDGSEIHDFLRKKYPDALIQVLQADVCRSELLVEIEAEFQLFF